MQKNKKAIAVFSSLAMATMISAAMSTPAKAANGDIYKLNNLSTPAYTSTANLKVQRTISLNSTTFGYELTGKIYKFDDLTALYNAKSNDFTATMAALSTSKTAVGVPTPGQTTELKVESVSAINAKTIGVTFSTVPTDIEKAKLTYEVKVGESSVLVKFDSWDGATAKIVRTSATAFDAGVYTATVKGLADGVKNVGTVTLVAQKASKLEITTTTLTDATAKAKIALTYQDQYGTDLALATSDFTTTSFNKTQNKSVAVSFDATSKYFYIDTNATAADFVKDDVVAVTFISNATGLKVTKDLTVGQSAFADTLTLGNIELPTGKTILTSNLTDIKVAYESKDQYGNDTVLSTATTTIISSDESVIKASNVSFIKDTDSKYKIKVSKFEKAGKATITLLNKASGNVATVSFDIQQAPGAISSVSVAEATKTIAASSTGYIALTVLDNYGTEIEAKDFVTGKLIIASSNQLVVKNAVTPAYIETIGGDNYGKLAIPVDASAPKDATANVTITDATTGKQYATVTVKAGEAVKPTSIEVSSDSEHATTLIVGATTSVDYVVKDQYGNELSAADAGYKVIYVIKDSAEAITETAGEDTDETSVAAAITAAKTGTAVLQTKLVKNDGTVIDVKETTFTVTDNNASGLTYSLKALTALVDDTVYAKDGTSAYAQPVVVKATDASGNNVAISANQILSVVVINDAAGANAHVDVSSAPITVDAAHVDTQEGYYVISAKQAYDKDYAPTIAKVRVTLNTADGIKVLESAPITFAKDAPVAQELKIVNKSIDINDPSKLQSATTDVTSISYATQTLAKAGTAGVFVNVKDQYGVWKTIATDFIINTPSLINLGESADKFATTTGGALTLTDTSNNAQFTAGSTITLSALSGAVSDTLTVKILAETLATVTTKLAAPDVITLTGPQTLVFSEELSTASKAAVKLAVDNKYVAAGTATYASAWGTGATAKTLTITLGGTMDATNNVTSTVIDPIVVTDMYGNDTTALAIQD